MNMNTISSIYKITHVPTDLVYIGRTTQDPRLRFCQHIELALSDSPYKTKLHRCIEAADFNDLRLDVLETGIENPVTAILKEKEYIAQYDSFNNGLNSEPNGVGNRPISSEIKNMIVDNYQNGYSIKNICRNYNVSSNTVKKNN